MTAYVQPDVETRKPYYEAIMGLAPLPFVKKLSRKDRKMLAANAGGEGGEDGEMKEDFRFAYTDITVIAHVLHIIQSEYTPLTDGGEPSAIFIDLGSGVGHALFAAALLAPFKQLVGCEKLGNLHLKAKELEQKYYAIFNDGGEPGLPAPLPEDMKKAEITLTEGDMLEQLDAIFPGNQPGVKVIFCAATCMDDSVLNAVCEKAGEATPEGERVEAGAFLVTLTKMIPPQHLDKWDVIVAEQIKCPWGEASLFIHQKKVSDVPVEAAAG